jgi:hypothetical protein
VLNSDTVVAPDCLRLLVEEIESDAHIGIVCPRIFYGDEPELLWFGAPYTRPGADAPFMSGCDGPHRPDGRSGVTFPLPRVARCSCD